MIITQTKK